MKLRHLLFGVLAGVAFVACTNDNEPAGVTPVDGNKVATAPKYMTVNFVMPGGAATRGENDADGTTAESEIKDAAFLFFKDGAQIATPFVIAKEGADAVDPQGPYASEKDSSWDGTEAVVVMDNPTAIPTSLVVLINTGKTADDLAGKTLDQINVLADYSATTNGFIMSNAVYNDAAGENVVGAPVAAENVCETPAAARQKPVQVYVDRVLAKVSVASSVAQNAKISDDADEKITVNFTGWSLVYDNTKSYLIKKLGEDYDFTWTWNDPTNYRSYWAELEAKDYTKGAFPVYNAITKALGSSVYTQENTAFQTFAEPVEGVNPTNNPTAVIVAATLSYEGEATSLYKFGGVIYPEPEFKTLMADFVKYYKVTVNNAGTDDEETVYTRLLADDFDFAYAYDEGESYEAKVYLKLKATDGTYCGTDKTEELTAAQVNTALAAAGQVVEFWSGGKTYYFVPIKQHVATSSTDKDVFGIVRNHFYQLDIQSVKGLGTAVPNPEQEIVPITPEDKYYYIAAQITVNPWKLVSQSVNLGE